jgi:hypothetical protein
VNNTSDKKQTAELDFVKSYKWMVNLSLK